MVNKRNRELRRGDTLIEVTIAIGIFSLIAVMAVMVVNTSISGTQATLESTVTREEINAQAEALRFIQAAYAAGKGVDPDSKYGVIWKKIVDGARVLGEDEAADAEFLSYQPATCGELYDTGGIKVQGAFIINIRALGLDSSINNTLITPANYPWVFRPTSSYPRIMYGYSGGGTDYGDILYSPAGKGAVSVQGAEGIYIVAVRDEEGTNSVVSGGGTEQKSAFIDFYIRTCWYTMNSERPSTISTVVRLYNPDYMD